jgi:hypothetical protein
MVRRYARRAPKQFQQAAAKCLAARHKPSVSRAAFRRQAVAQEQETEEPAIFRFRQGGISQ